MSYSPRTKPTSSYSLDRAEYVLLNEDGSSLLNEDGSTILLEGSESKEASYDGRTKPTSTYSKRITP